MLLFPKFSSIVCGTLLPENMSPPRAEYILCCYFSQEQEHHMQQAMDDGGGGSGMFASGDGGSGEGPPMHDDSAAATGGEPQGDDVMNDADHAEAHREALEIASRHAAAHHQVHMIFI